MQLRAPPEDRAVLAEPPLPEATGLTAKNHRILDRSDVALLGRPLHELRSEARRAAVEAAGTYLRQAGQPLPQTDADSILVSGHQPELFHPGVWLKNFALFGLARRCGALPLNLIVDSDAPKSTTLRVPFWRPATANAPAETRSLQVPFDYWYGEIPYEERAVQDESVFASFAERSGEIAKTWPFEPLLPAFWQEVMIQARRTHLLGERFAAARRSFERRWGCHNLEVPLSSLMGLEPAGRFMCHVLANIGRFQAIYNDAVQSYRRQHGLHSRNHPVPDLAKDGDWLEAPFWGWQTGQKRRGRLFVRISADRIELRAGAQPWPALSLQDPLPGWSELTAAGYKMRTRALTTTMFARLFLADLFIHGLGGAIYDELTDKIIRGFYRLEPPDFLVISGTLLLPFPRSSADERACQKLARELRDLRSNPQRHIAAADGQIRELAAEKERWIVRDAGDRHRRFEMLRRLTSRLQPFLRQDMDALETRLRACHAEAVANQLLRRRDFAFCFYPERDLRSFLESGARQSEV